MLLILDKERNRMLKRIFGPKRDEINRRLEKIA
jgi:hypothetical protein